MTEQNYTISDDGGLKKVTRKPLVTCLADVEPTKIDWLWPQKIPLGRITLVAGRPGLGKSFATCDLIARVTTGNLFPDGSSGCIPGSVILIACEDDPSDTIRPRLDAHGADASKVHLLSGFETTTGDGTTETLFNLNHVDILNQTVAAVPDCKLIVVDPIGSYLGAGTKANSDNDVRAVLAPIDKIAKDTGAAVLIIAHTRKATANFADDMVMGSRAFTGIARAVWHVMQDPDVESKRLFLPGKCNITSKQSGLSFTITGTPAAIEWGDVEQRSANDIALAASGGDSESGSAIGEAADWLNHKLGDGQRSATEIKAEAKADGLSEKTLHRASRNLGVVKKPGHFGGGWVWELPELAIDSPVSSELPNENSMANTGHTVANTDDSDPDVEVSL
jgi:hypothetical protein